MTEGNKERKPVRPVTVKIDDFRKKLNQAVADSELPPFLLEMIVGEMLSAMSRVADQERIQDREAWEKACADQERMQDNQEQGRKQEKACKEGEKDG
ncbi:MAG: hypothetical protein K1W40_07720 [Schaedlerella sp.]|uniref:hypothetical protein n=1 Tax=Schaedlerella sp. TaxID=2676057 RepID=UPI0035272C53